MASFAVALVAAVLTATCSARPTLVSRDYAGASDKVASTEWYSADLSSGGSSASSNYQCFHGQPGSYPTMSSWLSFDSLWSTNQATIVSSSGGNQQYADYIKSAITQVSQESNVDARLILAITMQESTGNVNAPCTGNGNCGLMQGPVGSCSFDAGNAQQSILQMIRDGVQGTSQAPGFSQYMGSGLSWVTNPYPGNPFAATRGYNSGSIGSDLDQAQWGTPSYSNDIGNRLLGWQNNGGSSFAQC